MRRRPVGVSITEEEIAGLHRLYEAKLSMRETRGSPAFRIGRLSGGLKYSGLMGRHKYRIKKNYRSGIMWGVSRFSSELCVCLKR